MPIVHYISHTQQATELEVELGNNLMMAAVFDGVDGIEGMCGGCLACATCHVYVDPAWIDKVGPPNADEDSMLSQVASERRPNSRLCCQIEMRSDLAGLVLLMPERQG
jgi:ferredoxin, 2Fe-2S